MSSPLPSRLPSDSVRKLILVANELGRCIDNIAEVRQANMTPTVRKLISIALSELTYIWNDQLTMIRAAWPEATVADLDQYVVMPDYLGPSSHQPSDEDPRL